MPKVKNAAFQCPVCGKPARVIQTRAATPQRLTRYRQCSDGHRITTREIPIEERSVSEGSIANTRIQFALRNLVADLGINIDSD
jgi:hypothetical protein